MNVSPPNSENELLQRAQALAGHPLAELAAQVAVPVPQDLRVQKGWVGELLEGLLGATAASLPEPDFPHLGIELKSLPVDHRGRPRESTYVCTVPLEEGLGETWESSWLRRKLARVLWVPVEADPEIPLAHRRVGMPMLWSPSAEEEALLRRDWEELMEMVCMGELGQITARLGEVLQIRPKAANASVRRHGIGAEGQRILTNPRGFYLRTAFTAALLKQHYTKPMGG